MSVASRHLHFANEQQKEGCMPITLADVPKAITDKPGMDDLLVTFVNHWGMDSYTPPDNVMESVRQIIILALDAARDCQS